MVFNGALNVFMANRGNFIRLSAAPIGPTSNIAIDAHHRSKTKRTEERYGEARRGEMQPTEGNGNSKAKQNK